MNTLSLNSEIKECALNICKRIASNQEIVAACFHGPRISGYGDEKSDVNILLLLKSSRLLLKYHFKQFGGVTFVVLTADQETFEKDVERDRIGGLIAEKLLTPYEPIINEGYLWRQEVKAKKVIVSELLGNLIIELPEMSHELFIKPEYFMFEAMARKASLFPLITFGFLNMMRTELKERNVESMMMGFHRALDELAEEGKIEFSDRYIRVTKSYINEIVGKHLRVIYLFRNVRRGIIRYIFRIFPNMTYLFMKEQELYNQRFPDLNGSSEELIFKLEDPKEYIFTATPLGLVSLSERITIEEFVRKNVPGGHALEIETKKLGGVLNTVYLLTFKKGQYEERVVVKMFKDWYSLKWFPLALWALGTRGFAVLGKSRLEKEYAINRYLSSHGIHVPKVIYITPKERLIFEEYIDGVNLVEIVKRAYSIEEKTEKTNIIKEVGKEIAKIHKLGVALGDCKPENVIVDSNENIYFVDLEQAVRGGDQAWDIAEFLYYLGHHLSISPLKIIKIITREFIEGYLEAGGKRENVKKIRSPKYVKVFSFFTPPHIVLAISNYVRKY